VANIVGTRPGTRMMVPRYGLPDPTFVGFDVPLLKLQAQAYEPRATGVAVAITPGGVEYVTVEVAGGDG
jgi:hypothetical protein